MFAIDMSSSTEYSLRVLVINLPLWIPKSFINILGLPKTRVSCSSFERI